MFRKVHLLLAAVLVTFVLLPLLLAPTSTVGATPTVIRHHEGTRRLKALPSPGSSEDTKEVSYIKSLSVSNLRKFLRDREARCDGCVERRHLVERAMQTRGWMTDNERVASELTGIQSSAVNALSFQHMGSVPTAEDGTAQGQGSAGEAGMVQATSYRPQLEAVQLQYGIVCQAPLANGTQYCHQQGQGSSSTHPAGAQAM